MELKIAFFIIVISVSNVFATPTYSQIAKVSLDMENKSLEQVMDEIESQSEFYFIFNQKQIDVNRVVNIKEENMLISDILPELFKGTNVNYAILDRKILLTTDVLENNSLSLKSDNELQQKTVTGIVKDTKGQPLVGVTVLVKGTTTGNLTDIEGKYSLPVPDDQAILQFSYIGFAPQEMIVGNQSVINILLEESMLQMDEVVVTALGIKKEKRALSYAVQEIRGESFNEAYMGNVTNALSGKIAGITITNAASGVGSGTKVLLRGNRSISGSSQPLYIVDGITLNGDIANLSPDDVESISVLKGANAAALYGSRANNGAIVVVTKSGKGAPMGVTTNVGFTYTASDPIILLKFQNKYGQGSNGIYSENAITSWGPQFDGSLVKHWSNDPNYIANQLGGNATYPYVAQPNNVKDFFQLGKSLATNIGVNINSEKTNINLGYTYTDASEIVKDNDLTSHNFSMRIISSLSKKLKLDSKLNYIRQDFDNVLFTGEGFNNPMRYLYQIPRNIRTQDMQHYEFANASGQIKQHFWIPGYNGAGNPYWTRNNVQNPLGVERVLGMLSLKYDILDNLSIQGRSALDRSNSVGETKLHNDTYVTGTNGSYSRLNSNSYEWNSDVLLTYRRGLWENITINLNAGANKRVYNANALGASGINFQIQNLFSMANTLDPRPSDSYLRRKEVQSVYGFGDFSYKNAIFLNITGRNDWSSTLPSSNRSYFYPSIGLSAVVSELVKLPKVINYIKVKSSYAEVGNDTDPYNLFRVVSITSGTIKLDPTLPNAYLKPESTHSVEIGGELRMFEGKLRFDFTHYKTNTFDQLFASPVPLGSGVSSVFQNGADIQNKGFEFTFGASVMSNSDFIWDMDLNFSKNKSTVLAIADGFDELSQASDYIRIYKLVKGQPFGDVYARGFVRDEQGNVIVDVNGLPQITVGQDVKVANYNPDWLAGINNSFRYKNFTLNALVDIRHGGSFISFTEAIESGVGVLDYTSKGRDGSLVFGENIFEDETAVTESGAPNTITTSSEKLWNLLGGVGAPVGEAFVRDASNIRLRELILGYSLPAELLSKTSFKSARISLVGRNLFFFSNKAKYVDPEIVTDISNVSEGRESLALPTTRTYGVSINFSF